MCERTSFFFVRFVFRRLLPTYQHMHVCINIVLWLYILYHTIPHVVGTLLSVCHSSSEHFRNKNPKNQHPIYREREGGGFQRYYRQKKMCEITQYFSSISYTILYMYIYLKICCSCICENTFSCICMYVYSSKFCQKRYKKT